MKTFIRVCAIRVRARAVLLKLIAIKLLLFAAMYGGGFFIAWVTMPIDSATNATAFIFLVFVWLVAISDLTRAELETARARIVTPRLEGQQRTARSAKRTAK